MRKFRSIILFCLILVSSLNYYLAYAASSDSSVSTLTIGVNVDFSASTTSGITPLKVQFTDQSNAGSGANYSWQFGDGGTSNQQNPSYTYTQAGTYSVTLSIDDGITSDSLTRVNYINVSAPEEGAAGPFKPSPPAEEPPFITKVSMSPQEYSVDISWQTREPASTEIEWGRTQEYENGRIAAQEQDLTYGHQIIINDLEPDTNYHFRIIARTKTDYTVISKDYSFKTLYIDLEPPANISNFQASSGDRKIGLQWDNPEDEDFAGVKIVRSEEFFPLGPDQGEEVYNGKKEFFLDTGLENGKRYYYIGFAYDRAGNYSSGAIVTAFPWQKDKPIDPKDIPPIIPSDLPTPPLPPDFPPLPPEEGKPIEPTPPEKELSFKDIEFYQLGKRIYPDSQNRVKLIGDTPFMVLVKAEKLPQALKTIIVNLSVPKEAQGQLASLAPELAEQTSASYLLKINQDKTAYQTTINPPNYPGEYQAQVMILNYQDGSLEKIQGKIIIRQPISVFGLYNIPSIYALIALLFLAFLVILAVYFISCHRMQKKNSSASDFNEIMPNEK